MPSTQGQNSDLFRYRGESMTRIETFVAAAFAFAITMLVISLDEIPSNIEEFILAVKNIPSFVFSCALIIWIWYSHADWSRRYGLEDPRSIVLSGTLICVVLVYIYPLRLMMQGLFMTLSGGFFPFEIEINEFWELRFVFTFYSSGFAFLSLTFMGMYQHVMSLKNTLDLNQYEAFFTHTALIKWRITAILSICVCLLMLLSPDDFLLFTPYFLCLLWPASFAVNEFRAKKWQKVRGE